MKAGVLSNQEGKKTLPCYSIQLWANHFQLYCLKSSTSQCKKEPWVFFFIFPDLFFLSETPRANNFQSHYWTNNQLKFHDWDEKWLFKVLFVFVSKLFPAHLIRQRCRILGNGVVDWITNNNFTLSESTILKYSDRIWRHLI